MYSNSDRNPLHQNVQRLRVTGAVLLGALPIRSKQFEAEILKDRINKAESVRNVALHGGSPQQICNPAELFLSPKLA